MTLQNLDMNVYKQIAERLKLEQEEARNKPAEPIITSQDSIIAPVPTNEFYWTIPEVKYRGRVGNVDILKIFLDNGKIRKQDEWANYSESERANGNFYTPNFPLLYNALGRAFDLKGDLFYGLQVEEMRKILRDFNRRNSFTSLTKITYAVDDSSTILCSDVIKHNVGLKDEYSICEHFRGMNGEIPAESPIFLYESLFGTNDSMDKIRNVFNWLNDTSSVRIWRLQSGLELDDGIARLAMSSSRVDLDCTWSPTCPISSVGVRFVERQAGATQ